MEVLEKNVDIRKEQNIKRIARETKTAKRAQPKNLVVNVGRISRKNTPTTIL